MLTHQKATDEEIEPYCCSLFEAMPVMCLQGRSSSVAPGCNKTQAVFYGWRDHILPYILSDKHHPDTWFIVAEEDWRLFPSHCVPVPAKQTGDTVKVGLEKRESRADGLSTVPPLHPALRNSSGVLQ